MWDVKLMKRMMMWGEHELPHGTSTKSLGLTITDDCQWKQQQARHAAKQGHVHAAFHATKHILTNR